MLATPGYYLLDTFASNLRLPWTEVSMCKDASVRCDMYLTSPGHVVAWGRDRKRHHRTHLTSDRESSNDGSKKARNVRFKGPPCSASSDQDEASASSSPPPQTLASDAHVYLSGASRSGDYTAENEFVNGAVRNVLGTSLFPGQAQTQADSLYPFGVGRWWQAPVETPQQQAHLRACVDVLQECMQQYRGGEPCMGAPTYVYSTGISYRV